MDNKDYGKIISKKRDQKNRGAQLRTPFNLCLFVSIKPRLLTILDYCLPLITTPETPILQVFRRVFLSTKEV